MPALELFKSNLALLNQTQPELARRLESVRPSGRYEAEPSRSGATALFYLHADGSRKTLHSSYDPVKEAERFADSLDIQGSLHFWVTGLGLGYHLVELVKRIPPSARVFIVEKEIEVAHLALTHSDLTPVLAHPGVRLHVGIRPDEVNAVLGDARTEFGLNGHVAVAFKPLVDAEADYYAALGLNLDKALRESRIDLATKAAFSQSFYRNILENWDALLDSPGIAQLQDSLSGVPCVVVSAGPSLDKNAALLKSAGDKALIVTVATALKALRNAGIRPDFVMANDPDRSTLRAFGPGAPEPDLWLVYDPCVPADIVECFAGHRLAAESGAALSQWLARNHLAHGSLGTVLSVAHAAYQFARHLGCTPIILTGQDLAFDRTRMHCSGSFYDQFHCDRVNERLPVQSLEQQKFEGYAESLGTLSDVFGQPAATTLALDAYRNRFAEVIGGAADVINATEGGIPIPGVENRTLREALHRHCRGTVGERKKRFRDQIAAPPCPDALLAALQEMKSRFHTIHGKVVRLRTQHAGSGNGARDGKQRFVREAESLYRDLLAEPESLKLMQGYRYAGFVQWSQENARLQRKQGGVTENQILDAKASRDAAFLPVLEEASGFLAEAFAKMAERAKCHVT